MSPPVLSIHWAIGWMSEWMQQEGQGGSNGQESLEVQWSREMGVSLELRKGRASLVAQSVKKLPAVRKTWVRSLGREDPLEEGMATHSSILAWRILKTKEPGGLQSIGSQRVGDD